MNRRQGFTIVELLIVIVVIAILAAISVVAYTGIQDRANDATVEADIAAIRKKMEMVRIDLGHYPQSASEFPDGFKFSKSAYDPTQNNLYYCVDMENDRYAFGLRSKSMRGYIVNADNIAAGVGVTAAANCSSIDKTLPSDATMYVSQGYTGSTSNWNTSWAWID